MNVDDLLCVHYGYSVERNSILLGESLYFILIACKYNINIKLFNSHSRTLDDLIR